MIKVVFLIRSLGYGGAESKLIALANNMSRESFRVTVICFYGNGALEKDLRSDRVNLIHLDKRGRWDVFGFFLRLRRALRELKPDVLHGYLSSSNIMTVLVKPFVPSTKIIWGVLSSEIDWSYYDWFSRLAFEVERLLSPFADLIIANSQAGRSYHVERGFAARSFTVIHNGVDTELFRPDPSARARMRAEWGINVDTILIGLVARLDPIKDHQTFLRAASRLCSRMSNVHFVCVGDGPQEYALKLRALENELGISDKVTWVYARRDVAAVHNALDIASSSSCSEGMPNVIGEAMACGVPCVATDVGDTALLVGDTGIIVPPRNPEALAAGWMSCLESGVKEMGQRARSRVMERFNLKLSVEQTEQAILSTM